LRLLIFILPLPGFFFYTLSLCPLSHQCVGTGGLVLTSNRQTSSWSITPSVNNANQPLPFYLQNAFACIVTFYYRFSHSQYWKTSNYHLRSLAIIYLFIYTDLHSDSIANRHSCSTSAEMRDRKCISMQLILVVGKVDMINQICHMLSFC